MNILPQCDKFKIVYS